MEDIAIYGKSPHPTGLVDNAYQVHQMARLPNRLVEVDNSYQQTDLVFKLGLRKKWH